MGLYQQTTSDLVRNGEYERVWQRHCGFLDITIDEFMQIQRRLLEEQFTIAGKSRLWQTLFPDVVDELDADNFRELLPLTSYADYEPLLRDQPEDVLSRPIRAWARTSGRGGRPKWVPYPEEAYLQLGRCALGADVLSSAQGRGDINVRPNDVVVYNLPARPYFSGLTLMALSELFDFRFVPSLDETEQFDFQERNARAFQQAMVEGMDFLGSMTIVLVKMGERFEKGVNQNGDFSWKMLDPRLLWRFAKARIKARSEDRKHLLPRDLWQPKGIMCGGTDTSHYREQIKGYWGVYPHETYGCTEAGLMASQAWDHQDLTLIPSTAFYEFIPESDWAVERTKGVTPSETRLTNELEPGERYEVVVSNFYGGPFVRYRLHDLVEVVALGNEELGIQVPQFRFVGRSGDFIDLSGFAGLIDEKQLLTALNMAEIHYTDWVVCKEMSENESLLHFYIEPDGAQPLPADQTKQRLHRALKELNSEYANIEKMLGFVPLRVTTLPSGSFDRHVKHQVAQGADLAHLKPARIEPRPATVQLLLAKSDVEA